MLDSNIKTSDQYYVFQSPKIGSVVSNMLWRSLANSHKRCVVFQSPKIGSVVSNSNYEPELSYRLAEFQSPKIGSVVLNVTNEEKAPNLGLAVSIP